MLNVVREVHRSKELNRKGRTRTEKKRRFVKKTSRPTDHINKPTQKHNKIPNTKSIRILHDANVSTLGKLTY